MFKRKNTPTPEEEEPPPLRRHFHALGEPEPEVVVLPPPPTEIDARGNRRWKDARGRLHRDGGLPAIECADGHKEWWVHGKCHRDGGLPAIEWANGGKEWWFRGQRHRDGGLPAVDCAGESRWLEWWVHGKRHRGGGLPAVTYASGRKEWWIHGKCHRDGGLPAVELANGGKQWRVEDRRVTQARARAWSEARRTAYAASEIDAVLHARLGRDVSAHIRRFVMPPHDSARPAGLARVQRRSLQR